MSEMEDIVEAVAVRVVRVVLQRAPSGMAIDSQVDSSFPVRFWIVPDLCSESPRELFGRVSSLVEKAIFQLASLGRPSISGLVEVEPCDDVQVEVEARRGICEIPQDVPELFCDLIWEEHVCWTVPEPFLVLREQRPRLACDTEQRDDAVIHRQGVSATGELIGQLRFALVVTEIHKSLPAPVRLASTPRQIWQRPRRRQSRHR